MGRQGTFLSRAGSFHHNKKTADKAGGFFEFLADVHHFEQVLFALNADEAVDLMAVFKADQTGDCLHAIFDCKIFIRVGFVDVHFDDESFPVEIIGEFVDNRTHHAAGRAPCRPEVHQNRFVRIQNNLVEFVSSNV